MDYQETIGILKRNKPTSDPRLCGKELCAAGDVAISAMQELQIYKNNEKRNLSRTDRIMDECAYRHENGNCLKVGGFCTSVPLSHCQRYKDWYAEHRKYKKLGTLEQVQEAVDKQVPMKVINIHIDEYYCPSCGAENNCDGGVVGDKYCPVCGQRLEGYKDEIN